MPGPYTVTVPPTLLTEGENKGRLGYLHFSAVDSNHNEHRWWTVNNGKVSDDLRAIFGEWGPGILQRLNAGETVKLPRPLELGDARTIGGSSDD